MAKRKDKPENASKTREYEVGNKKPPKDKQFTSENQPDNNGRKPSMLKAYIVDNGVSIQDVRLVIKNIIMENTKEELEIIQKDEAKPMLMRVLIGAYLKDFESGSIYNLNSLLDRVYGKAEQPVTGNFDITSYSPKEREKRLSELEKIKNAIE